MVVKQARLPQTGLRQRPLVGVRAIAEGALGAVRRMLSNPYAMSCSLAGLLCLAGFGTFYLTWRGVAGTLVVGVQLAYLISGGFAGAALLSAGLGILSMQISRRLSAREDVQLDAVIDLSVRLLGALKPGGSEDEDNRNLAG